MIELVQDATFEENISKLRNQVQAWQPIPLNKLHGKAVSTALRLNALGSLFYHTKVILRRHRLTENLHLDICRIFEKEYIKDVVEIPRDHFKTTITGEGLPTWWALPLTDNDINLMLKLGYSDEWIK